MKRLFFNTVMVLFILTSCKQNTSPDQLINSKASLPESFMLSDLHQKVITSFISKKDSTMSILYGDEAANKTLSKNVQPDTFDASFTLVTWRQQNDPHWFGARIPGELISVETLKTGNSKSQAVAYRRFLGKNLVKSADTTGRSARINFILAQNPSIMP